MGVLFADCDRRWIAFHAHKGAVFFGDEAVLLVRQMGFSGHVGKKGFDEAAAYHGGQIPRR